MENILEHNSEASIERILQVALELFSSQGYRATTMRQIAEGAQLSTGNVYHHFGNKEAIFGRVMERYFEVLRDPELPLNKVFRSADFPNDLEELAANIEKVVEENLPSILLIYVDVVEFQGKHIHEFYRKTYERFSRDYGPSLAQGIKEGRFGEADPLLGVMLAVRWFFYFFTVEKAFGVPMHLGFDSATVTREVIKILRYGLLARAQEEKTT